MQQQAENQARLAREKQQREAEEARLEKKRLEAFACRRCPAKFPSNTKLHEHIRNHHAKKPKAAALPTPSTPPTPPTLPAKPIPFAAPSMPPQMPPTPPLTSPALPALPLATPPSTPKKPYLTVDNLFAMFVGRPKPIGLIHRQRNEPSPYRWQPSKPVTSHQTRITSYFLPVTPKSNKLDPNRQSSSAAGKLIGVGRFGLKRAFPPASISSWISQNQRHSAWTFPTYPPSRNTISNGIRAGEPLG